MIYNFTIPITTIHFAICEVQSNNLNPVYIVRDKYINSKMDLFTKFSCNSRRTKFKDILLSSVFQMVSKTVPISMSIIKLYVVQRSIPICVCWKLINTETTIWPEFINWESYCTTNTRISRNKQIQKCRTVRFTAPHIQERKLAIWVR